MEYILLDSVLEDQSHTLKKRQITILPLVRTNMLLLVITVTSLSYHNLKITAMPNYPRKRKIGFWVYLLVILVLDNAHRVLRTLQT